MVRTFVVVCFVFVCSLTAHAELLLVSSDDQEAIWIAAATVAVLNMPSEQGRTSRVPHTLLMEPEDSVSASLEECLADFALAKNVEGEGFRGVVTLKGGTSGDLVLWTRDDVAEEKVRHVADWLHSHGSTLTRLHGHLIQVRPYLPKGDDAIPTHIAVRDVSLAVGDGLAYPADDGSLQLTRDLEECQGKNEALTAVNRVLSDDLETKLLALQRASRRVGEQDAEIQQCLRDVAARGEPLQCEPASD